MTVSTNSFVASIFKVKVGQRELEMKPHAFMFYAVYHSGSVEGGFMLSYVCVLNIEWNLFKNKATAGPHRVTGTWQKNPFFKME